MHGNRVLIIDNDTSFRRNASRFLSSRGYEVIEATTADEGTALLGRGPQIVLVSLNQRDANGIQLVTACVRHESSPQVICTTKGARLSTAVAAVKAGALDVLERPVDAEHLYRVLEEVKPVTAPAPVVAVSSSNKPVRLKAPLEVDLLVANEERMQGALDRLAGAAQAERPVVLVAEAPLAEQLARRFQAASPRADGPFVVVPAEPEGQETPADLLFGTPSLTSAFAKAKGGVVFVESLVSLGESGRERLVKLVRGLEDSEASGVPIRWPPMIVATEEEPSIDSRIDRELADLLTRLSITVPRLHARAADLDTLIRNVVEALVRASGANGAAVDPQVLKALRSASYTGGTKELLEIMTDAACLDGDGRLVLELGRAKEEPRPVTPIGESRPAASGWTPTLDDDGKVQPYDVYEAEIFRFALEKAGGCVSRAAELLGVGRATMYRKMRAYSIDVPPVSERSISRGRRSRKRVSEDATAIQ